MAHPISHEYVHYSECVISPIKATYCMGKARNNVFLEADRLTHLSLASLLWDIGKQNSPRCDAAERGVPSGAILFS